MDEDEDDDDVALTLNTFMLASAASHDVLNRDREHMNYVAEMQALALADIAVSLRRLTRVGGGTYPGPLEAIAIQLGAKPRL